MNRRQFVQAAAATPFAAAMLRAIEFRYPDQLTGYDDWEQIYHEDVWLNKRTRQRICSIDLARQGYTHPSQFT